jgi:hypothetical protein
MLGNFKGNHTERMPKQKPESLNVIRGANLSSYNFHYRRPKSFLHTLKARTSRLDKIHSCCGNGISSRSLF